MSACDLCSAYHEDYRVLSRDAYVATLLNIEPLNEGHLIVIPKRHVLQLDQIVEDEARALHSHITNAAALLERKFTYSPLLVQNYGSHSSQSHLHFHILPSQGSLRNLITTYEKLASQRTRLQPEALATLLQKLKT